MSGKHRGERGRQKEGDGEKGKATVRGREESNKREGGRERGRDVRN